VLPVVGFVGASGSGKTTLIVQVLPALLAEGLRVAVLKHAHCGFDMDRPGKDSYRVREAGASEVLIVEGFARECYPKIEVYRPGLGEPPRCWPGDPSVIAVATDAPLAVARPVRRLDLNAPPAVAGFLLAHLRDSGVLRAVRAG
jgi:molybdopterin-guanine dinucleotide biosynthesis adapter protein